MHNILRQGRGDENWTSKSFVNTATIRTTPFIKYTQLKVFYEGK